MLFKIFLICVAIHIIGGILSIARCCKNGTMKECALNGSGQLMTPSQFILYILLAWEYMLLMYIVDVLFGLINAYFYNHYCNDNDCKKAKNGKTHWVVKEDE